LISLCGGVMAQEQISRITKQTVNTYARVIEIDGSTITLDTNSALMFDSANLPDTVLLIQMTGIDKTGNNPHNAGRYEFHIVTGVNGDNVTLKSAIAPNTFDPSDEIVQMVRVPS